jgi:two-component system invasion response regulator UvrY
MMKILIADDHPVVRQGVKQILGEEPDVGMFGEAQNSEAVLELVRKQDWDIVILDISMPDKDGLDVLKELKRERPKLHILIFSIHPENQYAIRALKAGAAGYVNKGSAPEELVRAIRKVLKGGKYVSPFLAEKLAFNLEVDTSKPPHETLSDREYQVMCMIASGKTVKEIAKEQSLSLKTISTYRARILIKMRMKSNAELIRYAIQNLLIDCEN